MTHAMNKNPVTVARTSVCATSRCPAAALHLYSRRSHSLLPAGCHLKTVTPQVWPQVCMLTYLVCETLSFAGQVIAGIPGEVVGGRSESILHGRFCQIRDRLNELSADANHDLQRGVHASYWQAVSLVCAMRAEQVGINADALFMRDKAADFFTGWLRRFQADAPLSVTDGIATEFNSSPGLVAGVTGWLKQRLRPDTPQSLATSPEIEWLERALFGGWERTAQVREAGWQPPRQFGR